MSVVIISQISQHAVVKTAGIQGPVGPQGQQGPKGDQGNSGPANVLSIGTVTTGAAGSSASASITGEAPSQTLNLTIPSGGGVLLASGTLLGATPLTFSSIPSTYMHLKLVWDYGPNQGGGHSAALTVNGDSGANYATSGNAGGQSSIPILLSQGYGGWGEIEVRNYASGTLQTKFFGGRSYGSTNPGNSYFTYSLIGGWWRPASAAPITSITITPSLDANGTFQLFGVA